MTKEYIKWNKEIPAVLQEVLEKVVVEFAKIEVERAERQKDLDQIANLKRELEVLSTDYSYAVEANRALSTKLESLSAIINNVKNAVKNV